METRVDMSSLQLYAVGREGSTAEATVSEHLPAARPEPARDESVMLISRGFFLDSCCASGCLFHWSVRCCSLRHGFGGLYPVGGNLAEPRRRCCGLSRCPVAYRS